MDERNTLTPDVGAYEGLKVVAGDTSNFGGLVRLIATYRGAEMLGIAGVVALYYSMVAPVANVGVHVVGMLAILTTGVTGIVVTGRQHASAKAGPGETQADP